MRALRPTVLLSLMFISSRAFAAAPDSHDVYVSFDLHTTDCLNEMQCPAEHLTGDGVAIRSAQGGSTLFAELRTDHDSRAVLSVVYQPGRADIRYTEVVDSMPSFTGMISDGAFYAPAANDYWNEDGNFAFRAIDGMEVRIIENGVITPKQPDVRPTHEGPYCESGCNAQGGVVVVVEDSGCGGDTTTTTDESDSGCEGDTTDSSSSSSSDDSSSSSSGGCEGDSSDSSSMSSGGCDDSSSSSMSSSSGGCEGDGASMYSKRASTSMFRLAWPVVLVGFVNRGVRARGGKKTPLRSSR